METRLNRDIGVEWSVASRALPGESVSGDQCVVAPFEDGVLLAVIDGLGHGDPATAAATRAVEVLSSHAAEPVAELVRRCHHALRDTRGAAMTLLSLKRSVRSAEVIGIGNVEMVLVRSGGLAPRESALLRNGVVGFRLPPLKPSAMEIGPGDIAVFATDGVRDRFRDDLVVFEPLSRMAGRILDRNSRGTDDALVLVCRLLPG